MAVVGVAPCQCFSPGRIHDSLAEGATKDEVLASYPSLRVEHINAALAYAAELAHEEHLVPIRAV